MCATDLDLDLEFAEDEEVPDEPAIDARYAGVAWGLAGADAGTAVREPRSS